MATGRSFALTSGEPRGPDVQFVRFERRVTKRDFIVVGVLFALLIVGYLLYPVPTL